MLVTMTHEDLPGVEIQVDQISYRYTWYPEGWRSDDDPSWMGSGLTPAVPHASDLSLHGGGQELDFAHIEADVDFTATGFDTELITGLVVSVPVIDRPVYLLGEGRIGPVTTTSTLSLALSPTAGTGASGISAAQGAKTLYSVPAVGTEANGRPLSLLHRIDPGEGGEDWCIVGVINSGATTARVLASGTSWATLRAVAA